MSDAFEKRIKKHIIGKPHRFLAVVPLGFEQTLINELDFIRQETVTELPHIIGDGKVEFTAKITEAWKAAAFSRIANRVLMHIADFKAENFRELEKKASEIPWELYLDDNHLRRESRPTELGMTEPNGWELSEAKVQRRKTRAPRPKSLASSNRVRCKCSWTCSHPSKSKAKKRSSLRNLPKWATCSNPPSKVNLDSARTSTTAVAHKRSVPK